MSLFVVLFTELCQNSGKFQKISGGRCIFPTSGNGIFQKKIENSKLNFCEIIISQVCPQKMNREQRCGIFFSPCCGRPRRFRALAFQFWRQCTRIASSCLRALIPQRAQVQPCTYDLVRVRLHVVRNASF